MENNPCYQFPSKESLENWRSAENLVLYEAYENVVLPNEDGVDGSFIPGPLAST